MKILAIIPARGGSKGLVGKNIKDLCGKPLICWTIDVAKGVLKDEDICVSTDFQSIADVVEDYGLKVPFLRPDSLASDTATTRDVIIHALDFYREQGKKYDVVLLLQPTSPLRTTKHVEEALALYRPDLDMVVSVKKSHAAVVIANDDENGFLIPSLNANVGRRQDMLEYYEYNGAVYVINVQSLYANNTMNFKRKIKYVMDEEASVDIDTELDLKVVELIKSKK